MESLASDTRHCRADDISLKQKHSRKDQAWIIINRCVNFYTLINMRNMKASADNLIRIRRFSTTCICYSSYTVHSAAGDTGLGLAGRGPDSVYSTVHKYYTKWQQKLLYKLLHSRTFRRIIFAVIGLETRPTTHTVLGSSATKVPF